MNTKTLEKFEALNSEMLARVEGGGCNWGDFAKSGIAGGAGEHVRHFVQLGTGLQHGAGVRHLNHVYLDAGVFGVKRIYNLLKRINCICLRLVENQLQLYRLVSDSQGTQGQHHHRRQYHSKDLLHRESLLFLFDIIINSRVHNANSTN